MECQQYHNTLQQNSAAEMDNFMDVDEVYLILQSFLRFFKFTQLVAIIN